MSDLHPGDRITWRRGSTYDAFAEVVRMTPGGRVRLRLLATGAEHTVKRESVRLMQAPGDRTPLRVDRARTLAEGGHLVPQPKPAGPWVSDVYRAFVRSHPCLTCARWSDGQTEPTEAHHERLGAGAGAGQKPSDTACIPLCVRHHRKRHDNGLSSVGLTPDDVTRAQRDCLAAWVEGRKR